MPAEARHIAVHPTTPAPAAAVTVAAHCCVCNQQRQVRPRMPVGARHIAVHPTTPAPAAAVAVPILCRVIGSSPSRTPVSAAAVQTVLVAGGGMIDNACQQRQTQVLAPAPAAAVSVAVPTLRPQLAETCVRSWQRHDRQRMSAGPDAVLPLPHPYISCCSI